LWRLRLVVSLFEFRRILLLLTPLVCSCALRKKHGPNSFLLPQGLRKKVEAFPSFPLTFCSALSAQFPVYPLHQYVSIFFFSVEVFFSQEVGPACTMLSFCPLPLRVRRLFCFGGVVYSIFLSGVVPPLLVIFSLFSFVVRVGFPLGTALRLTLGWF